MTKNSKILYLIILSVLIFQIIKFYSFYSEYSPWQYVEWLINYQGGFVGRGLPGEFLYQIHQFLRIKLDLLILVTVCTIYFYISFFLYKSVKYIQSSYINILIFLSPGFFLYPVMNSEVIGRKDILFCLLLGFFVFLEKKLNDRFLFLFTILAIFFLSLSHSVFLFYSPYLAFLFFLIKSNRNIKIKTYEILSFPIWILIIFLLIFFFARDDTTHPAPFISASLTNLLPSFFFPLIAKNKLFLLIDLVSIDRPSKFTCLIFPKILLRINLL